VGKYVVLHDAYLSVVESLKHGGVANNADVHIKWINSESITEENIDECLGSVDGIIVPGGFGDRGIEGMILTSHYARINNIPYFGIGLGMQVAVIEYAREMLDLKTANSTEFDPSTTSPIIDIMPGQKDVDRVGGTMRLGKYPCILEEDSVAYRAYGETQIAERHRHRYEINNAYRDRLESKGMLFTGKSPDGLLCEIAEVPQNNWYVGVQFHPEFTSRPNRPHPLFKDFIKHSILYKEESRKS